MGPQAEVTFLKSFGGDGFHIAELEDQDVRRMAELVEAYMDLPLGIVDAAVIAMAERLLLTEIATLDHRHFAVVRPSHTRGMRSLAWADYFSAVGCGPVRWHTVVTAGPTPMEKCSCDALS